MNKHFISLSILLAMSSVAMAQSWPEARPEAKAGLRWWWLGSAVDRQNIRWNMEQYAAHGAGAVEITPIYGVKGNEANNIEYLSPKWMDMLKFVEEEGKRTGIEVDMGSVWLVVAVLMLILCLMMVAPVPSFLYPLKPSYRAVEHIQIHTQ